MSRRNIESCGTRCIRRLGKPKDEKRSVASSYIAQVCQGARPQPCPFRGRQFTPRAHDPAAARRATSAVKGPTSLCNRRGIVPGDFFPRGNVPQCMENRFAARESGIRLASMVDAVVEAGTIGTEPKIGSDLHREPMVFQLNAWRKPSRAFNKTLSARNRGRGEDAA